MIINTDELRKSMENYYGTAIFSGMPMAAVDLFRVQNASDDELIRLAQKDGVDLSRFAVRDDPFDNWF